MSIKPICNKCKKELQTYGGLIFSPPVENWMVKKWHICKECYAKLEKELSE
jgi:predicted Zn-dependent protease